MRAALWRCPKPTLNGIPGKIWKIKRSPEYHFPPPSSLSWILTALSQKTCRIAQVKNDTSALAGFKAEFCLCSSPFAAKRSGLSEPGIGGRGKRSMREKIKYTDVPLSASVGRKRYNQPILKGRLPWKLDMLWWLLRSHFCFQFWIMKQYSLRIKCHFLQRWNIWKLEVCTI